VREETGLEGARALARQYGASVKRVYSVDTFVSSDSPVETTRFAHAPLGKGAVIRGLDNASIAPVAEADRILNIARTQNIPLQVGATNGGTDGSDFVRFGTAWRMWVCRGRGATAIRRWKFWTSGICRLWSD
jgi:putative aminopeptidase FrvX